MSIHRAGKNAPRRYGFCPRCRDLIQRGQWVKGAAGRGPVWQHAYVCPRDRH